MKKIIIQFSVALLLITGIYVYKYNNEKDLEVSNISQDIMNDYEDIIIKHGNEDEKVIALTFDDGPDKDFTPQVLDILKKNNVKDKNNVTQGRKGRMISTREELKNVIELEKKDIQEKA